MVRAPCCEKMGLKKGPWTPGEDQILISYIEKNGHGNWRALPKQAGLLRCGKSCRLRWINYLRPDIKRGNFTKEEEETIIHMHEMLGNRWSAIAAKLPGRTDNEIKNVWHTHLKKRLLKPNQPNSNTKKCPKRSIKRSDSNSSTITHQSEAVKFNNLPEKDTISEGTSTDFSSVTVQESSNKNMDVTVKCEDIESWETIVPEIEGSFWSEAAINETPPTNTMSYNALTISNEFLPFQYQFNPMESFQHGNPNLELEDDGMDFWYDIFIRTESSVDLPEF